MALSIHSQAKTIESLIRDYETIDPEEVLDFLGRYPALPPQLPDIREAIRRYFGDDRVTLSITWDSECPEHETLLVNVLLHADPHEALELLQRFDRDWWLDKRAGIDDPILVSNALQQRV